MRKAYPLEYYMDPEIRTMLLMMAPEKPAGDFLKPAETEKLKGKDLIRLAVQHGLTYQLLQFSRIHPDLFTGEQSDLMTERGKRNAIRSLQQLNELIRVCGFLNEKRLPYVCIKGPQLAHKLYGKSAMKVSVDLDLLLLNSRDIELFYKILTGLGYSRSDLNDRSKLNRWLFLLGKREVHFSNPSNSIHIDLHVNPGANTHLTKDYFKDFFADRKLYRLENIDVPVLTDEKYLVYLCYHGSLHQYSRLGWLADVRNFIKQIELEPDYNRIVQIAKRLNVDRSLFLTFNLLNRIFKDEIPVRIMNEYRDRQLIEKLTDKCLRIISVGPRFDATFRGRWIRMQFLFQLSGGLLSKMDLLFSIFMRHFLRLLGLIP